MSEPEKVYELICDQLTNIRAKRSLEIIHEICKEQNSVGARDFRIVTIAKLGANRGGPSEQTLRNKTPTGGHYRALIESWQNEAEKKEKTSDNIVPAEQYGWVKRIDDPTLRYFVLDLIAEVRSLKAENKSLSAVKKLEIDYRSGAADLNQEKLPALLNHEFDALKAAVDDSFLKRQGWVRGDRGCIKDANGKVVFKNGWLDVIEKILKINHC